MLRVVLFCFPAFQKSHIYGASTSRVKLFGTMGGRRRRCPLVSGGIGPNFAVTRKTSWVFESTSMVRAPGSVVTVWTTLNSVGDSSFTTVSVPSPFELKARPVSGSNRLASTPLPIGTDAITLPLTALITAIILLWQPANRRSCFTSIANPEGESQGAIGQRDLIWSECVSIASSVLLSTRLL